MITKKQKNIIKWRCMFIPLIFVILCISTFVIITEIDPNHPKPDGVVWVMGIIGFCLLIVYAFFQYYMLVKFNIFPKSIWSQYLKYGSMHIDDIKEYEKEGKCH